MKNEHKKLIKITNVNGRQTHNNTDTMLASILLY